MGTENREEQIVAPPLNSGPEARDTSVDVLRLRRAAQTDSALTRSASWAAKHMDEEEARMHLEEELSKAAKEKLAAAEAANAKEAATHMPRPPQHPPANKNSSPRRKNTSKHTSFSFVQVFLVRGPQQLRAVRDAQSTRRSPRVSVKRQGLVPRCMRYCAQYTVFKTEQKS